MYRRIRHYVREFVFLRSPGVALVRCSSIVVQLVFVALVTRLAGSSEAGVFFSYYAAILVASGLSRLGAEYFLVAKIPGLKNAGVYSLVSSLNLAITALTLILLLLTTLFRALTDTAFFDVSQSAIVLFWATVFLLSMNWSNVGAIRGMGGYLVSAALETLLFTSVFLVGLVLLFYFSIPTGSQLPWVLLASIGTSFVIGSVLASKFGFHSGGFDWAEVTTTVRETIAYWIASAVAIANTWLPLILLGFLAPPKDVSVFLLGQRLAAALLFGLTILNARYARDYAKLKNSQSIDELLILYRRNTIAQIPFVIAVTIGLLIFAPLIIKFSSVDHPKAYSVFVVLCIGTLASASCGPIVTASMATGHANAISTVVASTLLISMSVVLFFGHQVGGLQMAIIVAATMVVQNVLLLAWWNHRMRRSIA